MIIMMVPTEILMQENLCNVKAQLQLKIIKRILLILLHSEKNTALYILFNTIMAFMCIVIIFYLNDFKLFKLVFFSD